MAMTRSREHFLLSCRIIGLKSLELKKGKLSAEEQIEYENLNVELEILSELGMEEIERKLKEKGYL